MSHAQIWRLICSCLSGKYYFPKSYFLKGIKQRRLCLYPVLETCYDAAQNTHNFLSTLSRVLPRHRMFLKLYINYFIPCLNFRKIYGNFRQLRKRFKPVEELLFKKIYENFGKSLAIFRKILEIFGNSPRVFSNVFLFFLNFWKIFGNLRKCSEIFGNGSKVIFRCFYGFL